MRRAVSLGAGTPPSAPVFVTLSGFFAYFTHRRRTPNLAAAAAFRPPLPLFFGRRRRYLCSRRSRPSTPFIFVQHQPVASIAVIYPDRFIYSDNRGRHWPRADWRRNRRRVLLCWPLKLLRHGVQLVQVPVYACPVLATPPRAFVHDVSPGLASLVRRFVNFVFVRLRMPGVGNTDACLRLRCVPGVGNPNATRCQHHLLPGAPLLRHNAPMTNSAPLCARGSTATSSTLATLTRHRPRHSSHGYLDHGSTTHALGYLDKRHKGLPPCLSNRRLPLQPQLRDASTVRTENGVVTFAFARQENGAHVGGGGGRGGAVGGDEEAGLE
nr:hypothetical protein [Triticum aestivum]